jgi:hypothetical protein
MKLAEALLERKNLKTKVESLRARAVQNVLVQEGDEPTERPRDLIDELNGAVLELGVLIRRINATNNVTRLPDDTTISDAIVRRDMLNLRRVALEQVANTAMVRTNRTTRSEVKFVPTVNAAQLRKDVDVLAKKCRELDAQIQAVNWNTELVE